MKRLLLLLLSAGLVLATSTPAQAAATTVKVCNHPSSDDIIMVYNLYEDWRPPVYLGTTGVCTNYSDFNGGARVDVDISGGSADIDSWKKRKNDGAWGPCYNNEDNASNPYSDYTGVETEYLTYANLNC